MKHIVGAIRQIYYLRCGNCSYNWEEKSSNELRNGIDISLQEDQEIECPKCNQELVVKFDYQADM